MTRNRTLLAALPALAVLGLATPTQAATITWSGTPYTHSGNISQTMGIDQFDQTGTLVFAVNLGGSAQTLTQSADPDIAFADSDPNLSFSNMSATFNGFHAAAGANNQISRTGIFSSAGQGDDATSPGTITLSGLTIGLPYRVQVLLMDGRSPFFGRAAEFDGNNLGTFANGINNATWGDGLLATGDFTADATTQAFDILGLDGTTPRGGQANAIMLTVVPEPSSLALLGLGGLLIGARRRRN